MLGNDCCVGKSEGKETLQATHPVSQVNEAERNGKGIVKSTDYYNRWIFLLKELLKERFVFCLEGVLIVKSQICWKERSVLTSAPRGSHERFNLKSVHAPIKFVSRKYRVNVIQSL